MKLERQVPEHPVRFQRPEFPASEAIERYFSESRRQRWFSNDGPCLALLRDRLMARVGVPCIPLASGTHSLIAAIAVVRDRYRGNDAIVPSFTFPATVQS